MGNAIFGAGLIKPELNDRQGAHFIPKIQKKTVVMGCTQPYWSVLQVGSQHLARQFVKYGWDVHYFSAPISLLHLIKLFDIEIVKRIQCAWRSPTLHCNGSLRSYVPFSFIAPDGICLLRNKIVTHNWFKTMIPSLQGIKHKSGFSRVDLLYIDNLSYHFLLDQLLYPKSVFRVMDIHEGFPGWQGEALQLAQKIAGQVNLTAYSAQGLKNYVHTLGSGKSVFVPNGVDFDMFHSQRAPTQRPPLLKNIPDPVLLYSGMIDSRLDFDFIRSAAHSLPWASFVLAGPVGTGHRLNDLPANVYLTGPVPHIKLPELMGSAAAGLIPFDVNNKMDLIQGIRPLKLFEYLAAGIPVFAARWPELEKLDSPVWLYDSREEFEGLVYKALHEDYDQNRFCEFAEQYNWKNIFDILMGALSEE